MSASTGTIQRPMTGGSILGAIAIGVATLFAVGALAWGAANLTATQHVATPVAAPKPYLPAAAANQWSMTGGSTTGSATSLPAAAPKSYLPAAAANQWSMTGGSATGSTGVAGDAQNVVVHRRGIGKHAE
jgi:hypothetical protein